MRSACEANVSMFSTECGPSGPLPEPDVQASDVHDGRLLTLDALGTHFHTLKLRRDPTCPACAPGAELRFIDYEQFCASGT